MVLNFFQFGFFGYKIILTSSTDSFISLFLFIIPHIIVICLPKYSRPVHFHINTCEGAHFDQLLQKIYSFSTCLSPSQIQSFSVHARWSWIILPNFYSLHLFFLLSLNYFNRYVRLGELEKMEKRFKSRIAIILSFSDVIQNFSFSSIYLSIQSLFPSNFHVSKFCLPNILTPSGETISPASCIPTVPLLLPLYLYCMFFNFR